jgi:hypothetical protein
MGLIRGERGAVRKSRELLRLEVADHVLFR